MLLEENTSGVDVLALGEGEAFYVKFKDGEERWNVPEELAYTLKRWRGRKVVVGMSLGSDGDYWVQFEDGSECSDVRRRGYADGYNKFNMVELVDLGLKGDWVITGLLARRRKGVKDRLGPLALKKKSSLKNLDWRSKGKKGQKDQARKFKLKKNKMLPIVPLHPAPGGAGCGCLRPVQLVLCRTCGKTGRGRVRQQCKVHPNSIYLLDMDRCKECRGEELQELELPQGMHGAENKLVNW